MSNIFSNHYYINTKLAPLGTMACSYKYSYIRNYLNGAFYNVAFNSEEKDFIMLSENANDIASAGENGNNIFLQFQNTISGVHTMFLLPVAGKADQRDPASAPRTADSRSRR